MLGFDVCESFLAAVRPGQAYAHANKERAGRRRGDGRERMNQVLPQHLQGYPQVRLRLVCHVNRALLPYEQISFFLCSMTV